MNGSMTAINDGKYVMVPIPDPKLGPRKVDIPSLYDTECYRLKYEYKTGLPIFPYAALVRAGAEVTIVCLSSLTSVHLLC
jgi:hypothetical protein